jgi:hypothetical protein
MSSSLRLERGWLHLRSFGYSRAFSRNLSHWLEGVFDHCSSADHHPRFSPHADTEGQWLGTPVGRFVQRSERDKPWPFRKTHDRWTYPIELCINRSVALIWVCFEKESDPLANGKFWKA